jgi:hypothetical protein
MHDVLQSLVPGSARYGGHMLARPAPKRQREEPAHSDAGEAGGALPLALPPGSGAGASGTGEAASDVVMPLPAAVAPTPSSALESGIINVEVVPSAALVAPPVARGPASADTIVAVDSDEEEAAGKGLVGGRDTAAIVAAAGSGGDGSGLPARTAPVRPAHEEYFAAAAAAVALRLRPGRGDAMIAAWPVMTTGTCARRRASWRASDALSLIPDSQEEL